MYHAKDHTKEEAQDTSLCQRLIKRPISLTLHPQKSYKKAGQSRTKAGIPTYLVTNKQLNLSWTPGQKSMEG